MSYQPPLRTLQSEPTSSEDFKEILFQNFAIIKNSLSSIAHKKITQNIVEKYTSVGKQIIFDSENLNVELNRFQHYLFLEMTHRETNKVKILGNPSNIKTLNLQINYDSENEEEQSSDQEQKPSISVNQAKGVQRILKTCKYIQQLTIAFNEMSLTPQEVQSLSETLQILKQLKSITLDINVPTFNNLIPLSQSLQSLPLLSLSITSYPSEIIPQNPETFKEFSTKIAQISSLQHISFQNVPISQELSGLSNLKSLQLYYSPLQQLTLSQSESLQKITKNLQYLTLQTQDTDQLQETGFNALVQALQTSKNLIKLDLQIQDSSIKETDQQKIYQLFPTLTKLKALKLYVPRQTGVQGAIILSQNLEKLTDLKKLDLYFEVNNGILDEGVSALAKCLQNLVELRDLKLSLYTPGFGSSDRMTQKGAKALGNGFKNLSKLVNLDLYISNKSHISAEGAVGLAQGFEKLEKLEKLKLFIGKDNNIELQGAREIGLALSKLSHLKTAILKICFKEYAYEQLPQNIAKN